MFSYFNEGEDRVYSQDKVQGVLTIWYTTHIENHPHNKFNVVYPATKFSTAATMRYKNSSTHAETGNNHNVEQSVWLPAGYVCIPQHTSSKLLSQRQHNYDKLLRIVGAGPDFRKDGFLHRFSTCTAVNRALYGRTTTSKK